MVSIHVPTRGTTRLPGAVRFLSERFNPRSHEGNDKCKRISCSQRYCFNPRSHEGNDEILSSVRASSECFNPRSHEGNDTFNAGTYTPGSVSIHVPTRGTTSLDFVRSFSVVFQSTFPRGERRAEHANTFFEMTVSIHVPTRGTTMGWCKDIWKAIVSIHVPTRGTTPRNPTYDNPDRSFNPRSHEGNDAYEMNTVCVRIYVSIHVPTRGTTLPEAARYFWEDVSIHVPTRGTTEAAGCLDRQSRVSIHVPTRGTTSWWRNSTTTTRFQSTFPRGERRSCLHPVN